MRLFRRSDRRPMYGPPSPPPEPCNHERLPFQRCEKPDGHTGQHGRVIGTTRTTGGLIDRSSVTWEVWS